MAITLLPTPPTRDDPLNFAARADDFLPALVVFGEEANALATDVNAKSATATAAALTASNASNTAVAAADAATAAANYKGEWSSLSGALAIPASVSYQNNIYILTQNVADVTAHTPGVSSVWLRPGQYENPVSLSANANVAPFVTYKVTAGIIATLPSNPANGMWFRFLHNSGASTFTVGRNGKTIAGSGTDLVSDVNYKTFRLVYQSSTGDYLVEL